MLLSVMSSFSVGVLYGSALCRVPEQRVMNRTHKHILFENDDIGHARAWGCKNHKSQYEPRTTPHPSSTHTHTHFIFVNLSPFIRIASFPFTHPRLGLHSPWHPTTFMIRTISPGNVPRTSANQWSSRRGNRR